MLGFGARATVVLLDLNSAFTNIQIVVPSVQDLAGCESAEEVNNIQPPEEIGVGMIGFEGSAIFIPGPILRNAIIQSNTKKQFELIPILSRVARTFNQEHVGADAVRSNSRR